MTRRRSLGLLAAVAAAATLTSCVQVPDRGPVVEARQRAVVEQPQAPFNNPPPPAPGARPDEIVSGFLDAMTATPLSTHRAGEFLTKHARSRWRPLRVLAYTSQVPHTHGTDVVLRLHGLQQVGASGQWQGRGSAAVPRITFPMVREDGEWRIASAPDALILPRDFYLQHFEDAVLYFFDPTGHILVPEPVHVPQGSQLASSLVRSLLRAPASAPNAVYRTFIPPGLSVGLSVPVTHGVAEVNLKGPDPGQLDQKVVRRLLAQLAWTLRQDPTITAFTLSISGTPIDDESGASKFSVTSNDFDRFDPAAALASVQAYALHRGLLVSGQVDHPTQVNGPFGNDRLGVQSFSVNLDNTQVAAIVPSGLVVGPVLGDVAPTTVLSGPGLLRPSWDFAHRLWEVQDGPNGAAVAYFAHGRRHQVQVPGLTGLDVSRFLVSRDGSRLVAVLHGPREDRIVVSRLRYDADGRATGATRAHVIPWVSAGTQRIRDIGWTSPTTIAVLDQVSPAQAEVRILNVDGSSSPSETQPTLIHGRVLSLATSPSANQTPYAVQATSLSDISQVDFGKPVPIVALRHLTYAG